MEKIKISFMKRVHSTFSPQKDFTSGEDENKAPTEKAVTNQLIGTWKWTNPDFGYWYKLQFNEDLTGNKIDADNEYEDFTYSTGKSKVNFTSGFPLGEHNFSFLDEKRLVLFGDTFVKQD